MNYLKKKTNMGTSNFAIGNTTHVYTALMNREEKFSECNECNEKVEEYQEDYIKKGDTCRCGSTDILHDTEYRAVEDWEIQDFKDYLLEVAEEKCKFEFTELDDSSNNERRYTSYDQFSYSAEKYFGDINVEIQVRASLVSAYYEGASLDFEVEIYNGSEFISLESGYYNITEGDVLDDLFEVGYVSYNSDMGVGLRKIQSRNALKWIETIKEELTENVEEVFKLCCDNTLEFVGRASNGETFFKEIKN